MRKVFTKTAIVTLIILLLTTITFFVFAYKFNIKSTDNLLALGQVVVELCLIPVIIFGVLWTYEEFQRSQARAEIDIFWNDLVGEDDNKVMANVSPPRSSNYWIPQISLHNSGDAISTNFQVILVLPTSYRAGKIQGDWEQKVVNNQARLVYSSNGEEVLYPEQTKPLEKFEIPNFRELIKEELSIRYTVYSDRGRKKEGNLTIQFDYTKGI